ncbi:hypothetical protein AMS62_06815 [Bacillus sp. FJAT-18019]|nr:hypothetical protein AMS62_06815 [Bacillus sp. FJAT-18019]
MHELRQDKGFTLIEVLAAIVLLSILVTVMVGFLSNGFQSIMNSGERSDQLHITREVVEGATDGTHGELKINNSASGIGTITIYGEIVDQEIPESKGSELKLFIPTPELWKANVNYTLNDEVRYDKKNYKCIQPHTSTLTNHPLGPGDPFGPSTAALWVEF